MTLLVEFLWSYIIWKQRRLEKQVRLWMYSGWQFKFCRWYFQSPKNRKFHNLFTKALYELSQEGSDEISNP